MVALFPAFSAAQANLFCTTAYICDGHGNCQTIRQCHLPGTPSYTGKAPVTEGNDGSSFLSNSAKTRIQTVPSDIYRRR